MASLEKNTKLKTEKPNQKLWYQGLKKKNETDTKHKLPNHPTLSLSLI